MVTIWKPVLAALVIFAAGVVTGAMVVTWYKPQPGEIAPSSAPGTANVTDRPWGSPGFHEGALRDLSARLERQLDLTPAQQERIRIILREAQANMRSLAEEIGPRTREEFRQMRERIRHELTEDQRRRFEQLFRYRDGRQRRRDQAPPR
jgi:hypothetical protein